MRKEKVYAENGINLFREDKPLTRECFQTIFFLKRVIAILSVIALVSLISSNSFAQIKGDANGDGMVTSADITCVILAIFGFPCSNPDCNGDGVVTSADITCVIPEIFGQSPTPTPTGTCVGFCGDVSPLGCFCDEGCIVGGDCCPDFEQVCGSLPEEPPPTGTCVGFCGGRSPAGCFCDESCIQIGDCCPDSEQVCGPPPPSDCPSGQKDCPGVGCIPESSTCCGNGSACPSDLPVCTGNPLFCCPAGFPFLCPNLTNCRTDPSFCPP